MVVSSTHPTVDHANVADLLMGSENNFFAALIDGYDADTFVKNVQERFFDQGALYISGFDINVTSTEVNLTSGEMTIVLKAHESVAAVSSSVDYFFEYQNGTFVQSINLDDIDQYGDGTAIANNKYFNVVFGVVHNQLQPSRLMAVVQNTPSVQYLTLSSAEVDEDNTLNTLPSDDLLNKLFMPVARVVMRRTGSTTNTIQTLSNGDLFFDIRGIGGVSGGSAPSPSITDHGSLTGLGDDDHTQYLLADGTRALTDNWFAQFGVYSNNWTNVTIVKSQITGFSVEDTDMASESFGDWTCTGSEDGCTLNTDSVQDNEIDFSAVTLADFINDALFVANFTDANLLNLNITDLNVTGGNVSSVGNLSFVNDRDHQIFDNATCIIIKGDTSELIIC